MKHNGNVVYDTLVVLILVSLAMLIYILATYSDRTIKKDVDRMAFIECMKEGDILTDFRGVRVENYIDASAISRDGIKIYTKDLCKKD